MDRLFLDANVLFSAAYRSDAGLLRLWELRNAALCTSHYALEEARVNLDDEVQRERLADLARTLELVATPYASLRELPSGISLPEKDVPIMLAAMEARATHLLTGDLRHFRAYFGKTIAGILIVRPTEYLKNR